jgi:hypothetical protein
MPIYRDDRNFLSYHDAWGGPAIGLESERLQQCLDEGHSRGFNGVFGRHPEFQETDLSCLLKRPDLTSVAFWDIKVGDISAIYQLPKLTHFRISGRRPPINFERLPSIQHLVLEHHKKDTAVSRLTNLKSMNLWRFKADAKEMFKFVFPKGIEELGIFWSSVKSFEGFGIFPNVKKLEIARCRDLERLGDLKTTFPKLEHLVVDACGKLTADEAKRSLAGHQTVKHAFAGRQLIVHSER